MAKLSVLEGWGPSETYVRRVNRNEHARRQNRGTPRKTMLKPINYDMKMPRFFLGEDGNLYDSTLGFNPFRSIGHAVASAARGTTHVVADAARFTQHNVLRPVAHVAAEGGRAVGHVVMEAGRVAERMAKRLIKGIAKKVLFHGEPLLGEGLSTVPKAAAVGLISAPAAAAVAASPAAPAAPLVPLLVKQVVDELYDAIEKKVKQGLSPSDAARQAQADLDKPELGDPPGLMGAMGGSTTLIVGGIGAAALLFVLLGRRRK